MGEDLNQFPIEKGDYIIADQGYSRASGIAYVADKGAFICVRVNTQSLTLMIPNEDKQFSLIEKLQTLTTALQIDSWDVDTVTPEGRRITGRLCAIRKTPEAIKLAHKKVKRRASKKGNEL